MRRLHAPQARSLQGSPRCQLLQPAQQVLLFHRYSFLPCDLVQDIGEIEDRGHGHQHNLEISEVKAGDVGGWGKAVRADFCAARLQGVAGERGPLIPVDCTSHQGDQQNAENPGGQ